MYENLRIGGANLPHTRVAFMRCQLDLHLIATILFDINQTRTPNF